jgi:hypothetical protein
MSRSAGILNWGSCLPMVTSRMNLHQAVLRRASRHRRVRRGRPALIVAVLLWLMALLGSFVPSTNSAFSAQTANAGSTFTAAASFCTARTPVFHTGMESGVISTATGSSFFASHMTGGGALTVDSAVKRNGAYSLKLVKAGTGTSYLAVNASANVLVARFAVRLASLPGSDQGYFLVRATAGNSLTFKFDSATGKWAVAWGGGSDVVASSTVSAGTWYVIDLKAVLNTNPRIADWQVDGVAQTQATSAETASTVHSVRYGSSTTSDAYTANWDDLALSTTGADYPFGDGKGIALLPTGMGTSNDGGNLQDDDASAIDATTYTRLDDQPIDSATDWVQQVTTSSTSYVEVTYADTGESCFNAVSGLLAYAGSATGNNHGKTSIFEAATESVILSAKMDSAALTYRSALVSPTGGSWSQAKVNGLTGRVGYSTVASPLPYWHALMLEADVEL